MSDHFYHSRRELSEELMAARAASSVARIAHSKLAILHRQVADREVAAHVLLLKVSRRLGGWWKL